MILDHSAAPTRFLAVPALGEQPVYKPESKDQRNTDHGQPAHGDQDQERGFKEVADGEEDLGHGILDRVQR